MQIDTTQATVSSDFSCEKFCMFAWNKYLYDPRESMEAFSNCNVDISENLESWAKKFGVQSGLLHEIPEDLLPYFNYASWAQEVRERGDIWVLELFDEAIAVFYKRRV